MSERHGDGSTGHYEVPTLAEQAERYSRDIVPADYDASRVRHDDGSTGHYAPEPPATPRPHYTWVIDRDYIPEDADIERWGIDYVFADIVGPYNATTETANLARTTGVAFRMYDDDGMLYYSGKLWADDEVSSNSEYAFAPLDDFGTPNSGAVTIKYQATEGEGKWVTL